MNRLHTVQREFVVIDNLRLTTLSANALFKVGRFVRIEAGNNALRLFNGLPKLACVGEGGTDTLDDCTTALKSRVQVARQRWSDAICQ